MKRKFIWVVVIGLVVVALLAASCAPAPVAPAVKETAPAASAAPVTPAAPAAPVAPAAPAVKETAPAEKQLEWKVSGERVLAKDEGLPPGREGIKVTLKKLDGTSVTFTMEKPQYGGVLTLMGGTSVLTWDEVTVPPWSAANYMDMTHEELLVGDWTRGPAGTGESSWNRRGWFDHNYQRGMLAESWEIPDDTTIIFHLRKGVRWQNKTPVNGREFVADDVVYSLKRIYTNPTTTMYGMAGTGGPTDVYAGSDKYTVVVKTPKGFPYTTLDYVAGWTRIYAPEVEKAYGNQDVNARGVGTGPFIITDYVPQSSMTYVKNPNYWGRDLMIPENQVPYLDGLKSLVIPDQSTLMAALRTAKLDGSITGHTIPNEQAISLAKTSPQLRYNKYTVCSRYYWGGRLDKGLPYNDIRVRRALMMALDKQSWAENYQLLKGDEIAYVSFPVPASKEWARAYTPLAELPPSADGFDTKKLYGYYPEEAKTLLAEAGYPNGFKTEVVYTSSAVMDDLTAFYKAQWAKIGVELILDPKASATTLSMYQKKTFNAMLVQSQASDFPQQMYVFRAGNVYNNAMVNDPKIDDYFNRLSVMTPRTDAWWALLKEINIYEIQQVYYTTLPPGFEWLFWQPWVRRYYGESDVGPYKYNNQALQHLWLDKNLKKSMGY